MAVGAGGAFTGGVNRLPPVGLIDFSVGATGGGGAGVAGEPYDPCVLPNFGDLCQQF
jgi:hypothetical protein